MSRLEKFGVKMNLEIDYASHGSYETLILMAVQVSLIKLYSAVSIALCFCWIPLLPSITEFHQELTQYFRNSKF